jgi:hypothetical protein
MKPTKQLIIYLMMCCAMVLFFSTPVGDADIGWHLKYGEHFLDTGHLLTQNLFSWQMPEYIWPNHSWGFDVLAALLFQGKNFWALSIAAGIAITISLAVLINPSRPEDQIAIIVFGIFGLFLLSIGFRSQYLSLISTAILWKLLTKLHTSQPQQLSFQKWHLIFPLLFLCWANLHGQFIYGLGIMGLSLLPYLWSKRTSTKMYAIAMLACSIIATLINPFSYHLWTTAASHLNAPELHYINEWASWPITSPLFMGLISYSLILWIFLLKQRRQIHILLPLATLTVLAITSRRIIPYYILISLPYIKDIIKYGTTKINHKKLLPWVIASICLGISVIQFKNANIFSQNWDQYCHTNVYCSEKAIDFMESHQIQGKLWNAYRLGGHLIYRLPSIKPMIDGRMTVWRRPDGTSPFMEYTQMVYVQKNARQLFDTLNPDYVLIQPQYPLAQALLKERVWPVIFADEQVLLFQNPNATISAKLSH